MAEMEWSRRKATQSWQHLSAQGPDRDARWAVIWDTKRKAEIDGRNTAIEKSEAAALDRARHLLRMAFVVYEIREPSGVVFLMETDIRARVGLPPEPPASLQTPMPGALEASAADESLRGDDLAQAMIEVHGNRAAGVARENARAAVTAGQVAVAKNWLRVVETIQLRKPGVP